MIGKKLGRAPGLIVDFRRLRNDVQDAWNSNPQENINHLILT